MKEDIGIHLFGVFMVTWTFTSIAILFFTEAWPLSEWQIGIRMFGAALVAAISTYNVKSVIRQLTERDS